MERGIPKMLRGMLIGAAIGAVSALLMAPRKGEETREMVKQRLGSAKDRLARTAQDMRERGEEMKVEAEQRAEEMKEQAREESESTISQTQQS